MKIHSKVILFYLLLLPGASFCQTAQSGPLQAVHDWYNALDDFSGRRGQYNGSVGQGFWHLQNAYNLLALALQKQISESQFEEHYAQVAHLELLQVQLGHLDQKERQADVFVEEERTMVFGGLDPSPKSPIPAVAWYEGVLHLTEISDTWEISKIDLKPEDLISTTYGGHEPWKRNPLEVAKIAAGQFQTNKSNSGQPCSSATPQLQSGVREVQICGDRRYQVRLVELHSGEWRVISIDPLPAASYAAVPLNAQTARTWGWGDPVDGLQVSLYIGPQQTATAHVPSIRLGLRNVGSSELDVLLGGHCGPEPVEPTDVVLVVTDSQGKSRPLVDPRQDKLGGCAGVFHGLKVFLSPGGSSSVAINLDYYKYLPGATTLTYRYQQQWDPGGTYSLRAEINYFQFRAISNELQVHFPDK